MNLDCNSKIVPFLIGIYFGKTSETSFWCLLREADLTCQSTITRYEADHVCQEIIKQRHVCTSRIYNSPGKDDIFLTKKM